MFEFLGRGKRKTDLSGDDAGPSTQPQTVQLNATQIEMVRMTLHGVLKLHGIPASWIAGEVIPVHLPGQGEALLLHLEVMHWHDALVLHAPAFQQAMLDGLKQFDPQADQTRYLFAWKFSEQSGCPHIHLPEPDFWASSEAVLLTPTTAPVPQDGDDADDDHGFAPTQIPGAH